MDRKRFMDALLGLIAIDSVAMRDADEAHPYGKGPAEALAYVLELCRELGIATVDRGGKVAWAEIGRGEEIVGILGHLDVVPVGDGWTHDPKGELVGDRLYGRGAVDDKGPVMAALFAMKAVQDSGVPLKRRVRLIFGQREEVGDWQDMAWYREHEQLPAFGFTPDAEFPAIYGEKGILHYELTLPLKNSGLSRVEGGDAANMVPGWARAEDAAGRKYEAEGKSAHASTPEQGQNAISSLMRKLDEAGVDSALVRFYVNHIGADLHGERMGCAFRDEQSGQLTLNVGMVRTTENSVALTLDIRNPVTFREDQVRSAIETAAAPYGIAVRLIEDQPSVYLDRNGPVINAMLSVYRELTGDLSDPKVIGGGTYARAMPGIVAFGPMRPGRECTEHQKDEYILLEDLFLTEEIYEKTIEKLANFS